MKPSLPDCCVADTNSWSVWRHDRLGRPGGGACILTRNEAVAVSAVAMPPLNVDIQLRAIDLHINDSMVRLINVYRPPANDNCSSAVDAMKRFLKCLTALCDCGLPVLLVGDLNLPNIDWCNPVLVSDIDCCSVRF